MVTEGGRNKRLHLLNSKPSQMTCYHYTQL